MLKAKKANTYDSTRSWTFHALAPDGSSGKAIGAGSLRVRDEGDGNQAEYCILPSEVSDTYLEDIFNFLIKQSKKDDLWLDAPSDSSIALGVCMKLGFFAADRKRGFVIMVRR